MRRLGLVLTCLAAICALSLTTAGASLANSSCSGSAGDQQYVDPLGCPTTSTGSTPPPTTTPTQQTTTPSATVANATTATTPTAADPKSSKKALPYTGLDIWPAIALGVGLLGAGLALRRCALAS
jgi:hypothetical protein